MFKPHSRNRSWCPLKIEFLGNDIERDEIKMLPKRATGLQNMKTPKTLADLQRLLGMANYRRTYIP